MSDLFADFRLPDPTKSNWRRAMEMWEQMSLEELDRLSIPTGCETDTNRRAAYELRSRGYRFNAQQQKWVFQEFA